MTSSDDDRAPILSLEIVGAGNAWWVAPGAGPSDISTYVFVNVEQRPELLALPDRTTEPGWWARARRCAGGSAIRIEVAGQETAIQLDVEQPQLEAVRRAHVLYFCPTTPRLGLDPRLARDRSVRLDVTTDDA